MSSQLPSYASPPITEVVVGVGFRPAPGLTLAHIGELWSAKWKSRFPRVEEHPPYVPPLERFDVRSSGPTVAIELMDRPATRLWFVTDDGQELIQVQREWFACNWRKVGPGSQYDRWPARRAAFARCFSEFADFVTAQELGALNVTQCEVTYVNHILGGQGWSSHGELARILRLVSVVPSAPEPEQIQVGATFIIPGESGQPVGRLHVTAQPAALREGGTPIIVLNLTARGGPDSGADGVLRFLDRGRESIVKTFASLTTDEMHRVWGRHV